MEQTKRIRCWFKVNSTNRIFWPIKNIDRINVDAAESRGFFNYLRKNQRNELRIFQRSVAVSWKMKNYRYIIKSCSSHDKFLSGNNEMDEEIKNPETSGEYTI